MPYSAAKKLYENVTLDEKVIVYGGVDKVAGKAQSLGGADSYNVTEGDGAFNLGVTAEDNAKLTYSSDNEGVVRVDENGNVTIAGVGTATITVKSESTTSYKAGSKTITITVNAKPQPELQQPTVQQQPEQNSQQQVPKPVTKKNANVSVGKSEIMLNVNETSNIDIKTISDTVVTIETSGGDAAVASLGIDGSIVAKKAGQVKYKIYCKATSNYNESNIVYITINVKETSELQQPETSEINNAE